MNLTQAALRRWLRSLEPACELGMPRHPNLCPIAAWLETYHPLARHGPQVDGQRWYRDDGEWQRLPDWAVCLIYHIDRHEADVITAGEVLTLLEEVSAQLRQEGL